MKKQFRALVCVWSVLFSLSVFASAVVENPKGEVKAGPTASAAATVTTGQRVQPGSTVVTGAKSTVTLRFDDGQVIILGQNSEFKVTEYSFSKEEPQKDRFVFDLLRGAMRSVTGALTRRNSEAYSLRTPQATIGIRGTDFMVALVNPAFMSVLNGAIGVTNKAGSATFAAGSTATVPSATAPPVSIPASSLPASVASSFSELSAVPVSTGPGAAGSEATGAAFGGLTPAAIGIAGAIAAGLAGAASDDNATPGTTGTTGTTGTSGAQ